MRLDDKAVAGFFEDLPVLMFILAGVACLVSAGLVSVEVRNEGLLQSELDAAAQSLADNILARLRPDERSMGSLPSVHTLEQTDFNRLQAELSGGYRSSIGLVQLLPICERLYGSSGVEDPPLSTGYAARFMNAIDESGLVVILELRVIVWR